MTLDHVIPGNVYLSMNICREWGEDFSNRVLACAACNGFCNRYSLPVDDVVRPVAQDAFYDIRDRIFDARKKLIATRHEEEREFFNTRSWEKPGRRSY
jgi:hypothetical protein